MIDSAFLLNDPKSLPLRAFRPRPGASAPHPRHPEWVFHASGLAVWGRSSGCSRNRIRLHGWLELPGLGFEAQWLSCDKLQQSQRGSWIGPAERAADDHLRCLNKEDRSRRTGMHRTGGARWQLYNNSNSTNVTRTRGRVAERVVLYINR